MERNAAQATLDRLADIRAELDRRILISDALGLVALALSMAAIPPLLVFVSILFQ